MVLQINIGKQGLQKIRFITKAYTNYQNPDILMLIKQGE